MEVRSNIQNVSIEIRSPHRLVVRTSRRGRDNPGSTPGVDIVLSLNVFRRSWMLWKCIVIASSG